VLDWGLGHATRSIPVINELLQQKHSVIIASSSGAHHVLKLEFPELKQVLLPGYFPVYPEDNSMVWKMAAQLPRFISVIQKERQLTEKWVKEEKIDVVISDNRYGCYSKYVKSIFITHQIHLLMPRAWKWMERGVNAVNHSLLSNYRECWIPADDTQLIPDLLAGCEKFNCRFTGYLSRLEKREVPVEYDVVAVSSGPSPQKEIFAWKIHRQLKESGLKALLVYGDVRGRSKKHPHGNFTSVNYLDTAAMNQALQQAKVVVARSGYSTVMDVMKLGKKAVFVPTPGQTEQEYLAKVLMEKGIAYSMSQQEFNLEKAVKESEHYTGFQNFEWNSLLLKKAVQSIG
jgi:predicted glycosyltransferase